MALHNILYISQRGVLGPACPSRMPLMGKWQEEMVAGMMV